MQANRRWYEEPFLWLLIAIPTLAVISGIAMLVLALNSDDGLVADDYYRRGKEINRELKRDQAAQALGASAILTMEPAGIVVDLALAHTPAPMQIEMRLLHVTRDGYDRTVLLPRGPDGRYRGAMFGVSQGKYHVQLAADTWRIVGSMTHPSDARVRLEPAT